MTNYTDFLKQKSFKDIEIGFTPKYVNNKLYDFQQALVDWACQRGRAGIFTGTGTGKTSIQCEWAKLVHEYTNKNVLILAPLCVAQQTIKEAAKFDIEVKYCRNQSQVEKGITITNYEMADRFDPNTFVGVVGDELSIIKHVDSKTRSRLIELFGRTPYKLSCTATPAPNDYMELGNQAEFLNIMSATEMLAMFFTHDGGETAKWRLKGHGKSRFWEWLSTWSVCINSPSDLGFDGSRFILPKLNMHEHIIDSSVINEGEFFPTVARTLKDRRKVKRASIGDRVNTVAELVNNSDDQWVIWCNLNDESSALAKAIPDAVEVYGTLDIDQKEERIMSFTEGESRVLISKSSITGFGMNWQHCHKTAFVGIDDSFEKLFQAIRRFYRFGQKHPVDVHMVLTESELMVKQNLDRKEKQNAEMSANMVNYMREFTKQIIKGSRQEKTEYDPKVDMIIPEWVYTQ